MLSTRTIGGMSWSGLAALVQTLLSLLVTAILARLLTPDDFGVMGTVIIVLNFINIFARSGVGPALVQRLELDNNDAVSGMVLALLLSALGSIAVYFTAPIIGQFFEIQLLPQVLRVSIVILLLNTVSAVALALLQRDLRFRAIAMINVVSYAAGYCLVAVVLGFLQYGVWALVFAQVAQSGLRMVLSLLATSDAFSGRVLVRRIRSLFRAGLGFTLSQISNQVALQGDNIIIGKFLGPAALGLYGRAYQVTGLPAQVFHEAVERVIFPALASIQNAKDKLARGFLQGSLLTSTFTLPATSLLAINAGDVVLLFLGEQWTEAAPVIQVLSVGILFRVSYKISSSLLRAMGRIRVLVLSQVLNAVVTVCAAFLAVPYGLVGIAWSISLALAINYFVLTYFSARELTLRATHLVDATLPGLMLAALGALAAMISRHYIYSGDSAMLRLTISVCCSVLIIAPLVVANPRRFLGDHVTRIIVEPVLNRIKIRTS